MYLLKPNLIFDLKVMIIGSQVNNSLNESDNGRNSGPAEQQVDDSLSDFSQIKFVDADTAKKNCQNTGSDLALDWPCGIYSIGSGLVDRLLINRLLINWLWWLLIGRGLLINRLLRSRFCRNVFSAVFALC